MRRDGEHFEGLSLDPRFRSRTYPTGQFVVDDLATASARAGLLTARREPVGYVVPQELRQIGSRYRRDRLRRKPDTFNGRVVGLDTNLGLDGRLPSTLLTMRDARYFDHLATDIMAMHDVLVDDHLRPEFGRSLFVDRRGRPRDFGDSWLLNAVGASVLAITTDGRFVAIAQTESNETSGGLYAPSGSGSIEPKDFAGEMEVSFDQLVIRAALREMSEEAAINGSDVAATAFLGFGRWMTKAGKPEGFTLVALSIDSHEVTRRRVSRADHPYTRAIHAFKFRYALDCTSGYSVNDMVEMQVANSLSLPLATSIDLLRERAVGSVDNDIDRDIIQEAVRRVALSIAI